MKLSDRETQAVVQIANRKLSGEDPAHRPRLFDQIYSLWADEKYDGWIVSLQRSDGRKTDRNVVVYNSEIEFTVKFLREFEQIKLDNDVVSGSFKMSPNDEIHALRLAVVGLVMTLDILAEKLRE